MILKKMQLSIRQTACWLIFFNISPAGLQAQDTSKYGVPLIRQNNLYIESCRPSPDKQMIELKSLIPDIQYDLRYASSNNFTHRPLYPTTTRKTFMRKPAAIALASAQEELRKKGFGILVFDAYRPYGVTEQFWELIHDERYVANPAKGSGHNRGLAIDLTLIDLRTSTELAMGTGFDNFTDTAHATFTQLPQQILQNRQLLSKTMMKNGFEPFATEWWHFAWPNNQGYEVLDLSFDQLQRFAQQR